MVCVQEMNKKVIVRLCKDKKIKMEVVWLRIKLEKLQIVLHLVMNKKVKTYIDNILFTCFI